MVNGSGISGHEGLVEDLQLDRLIGDTVYGIARDILVGVDQESPVDTGLFRGNWQVGVGTVPEAPLQRLAPGGESLGAELSKLDAIESAPRTFVTIANNLPYAERLNSGHSAQAPAGFVEAVIDRAVQKSRPSL